VKLSHTVRAASVVFDDPNLVSSAGLVPMLRLAERAGLRVLADQHLSVPTGANPGLKVASLVAGMVAGADSIDDLALLRHGGMGRLFAKAYAPSTLGSFLRSFTFGHVRQLDAVASRFLAGLAQRSPLLPAPAGQVGAGQVGAVNGWALLDVDDTVIEVHGYAKQGAGFGYNKVRGLNVLIGSHRLMGAGEPVLIQTRVDRFLTSPQCVDVGTVGGEAGHHLGTLGNGAVAGDQDIDVPGGLTQPLECPLVGAHLIGAARVEQRDQDVGEHVAGEQDAPVGEQDRGVADGVRLMLDNLARHAPAVRGQRGDEPYQFERYARRALRRHPLRPLSGLTGSVGAGGGGVARDVAEPGMPQQVVPVGMGGEPGDHRNAEPVHEPVQVIGELVQLGTIDAGIDQDQPTLSAHHDGIAPDPRALPDPDALGHLIQHRFTLSVISARHNHAGQDLVGLDQHDPCWRPADSDPDYTLDREEARYVRSSADGARVRPGLGQCSPRCPSRRGTTRGGARFRAWGRQPRSAGS